MSALIPTNRGPMTPGDIADEVTYGSYAANRGYGLSPEKLAGFFGEEPARRFEERYRREWNAGARQADDERCELCGDRSCGCEDERQREFDARIG